MFYFTINRVISYNNEREKLMHMICIFITFPFNIMIIITMLIAYISCQDNHSCNEFVIQMLVVIEYYTAITCLVYLTRYYDDIKDMSVNFD